MPFNLFNKKKEPQQETPAMAPQEEPKPEAPAEPTQEVAPEPAVSSEVVPEPSQETSAASPESPASTPEPEETSQLATESEQPKPEAASKTYLKAMPLKELSDVASVEAEVRNGNIIILRVTPLAGKSIEDVKTAVNELFRFAESIGGDIARLGEERVVICPKTVRIWREKTPAPVPGSKPLPTAA